MGSKELPIEFLKVDKDTDAMGFTQRGVVVRKKGEGRKPDTYKFLPCAKLDVAMCDGKPGPVKIIR